jgi:hypothetical protein
LVATRWAENIGYEAGTEDISTTTSVQRARARWKDGEARACEVVRSRSDLEDIEYRRCRREIGGDYDIDLANQGSGA